MKENFKFTIYLAGYNQDLEYRKIVKKEYGKYFNLIDPMTITFEEVYNNIGEDLADIFIVKRDKKLIDKCDILVAKIEYLPKGQIMVGTIMEIMYAYTKGIPVFLISSEERIRENAWLKFHSEATFCDIEECFDFITNK